MTPYPEPQFALTPSSSTPTRIGVLVMHLGHVQQTQEVVRSLLIQTMPPACLSVINLVSEEQALRKDHLPDCPAELSFRITPPDDTTGFAAKVNNELRHWLSDVDAVVMVESRLQVDTLQKLQQTAMSYLPTLAIVSAAVRAGSSVMTRAYSVNRWNGHLKPVGLAESTSDNIDILSRYALLIPAEVFRQIGLMDQRYHRNWELSDFCLRAKSAHIKLLVEPQASVVMQPGNAISPKPDDMFYHVRNRRWVLKPYQNLFQQMAMFFTDGWQWFNLVFSWLTQFRQPGAETAYETARLFWWGVYEGVNNVPPKVD